MGTRPERALPARAQHGRWPARWAEPGQRPSAGGLVVAALVGSLAAGSWTLSAWLSLGRVAAPPDVVLEIAGTAVAPHLLRAAQPPGVVLNTNE